MLDIRKAAIAFDENELLALEGIVTDRDAKEALRFLKKAVWKKWTKLTAETHFTDSKSAME